MSAVEMRAAAVRRRFVLSGIAIAVVIVATGVINLGLQQRWLWWPATFVAFYAGLRIMGEGDENARLPWRAELVPLLLSVVVAAAIVPIAWLGFGTFLIAAVAELCVWVVCARLLA